MSWLPDALVVAAMLTVSGLFAYGYTRLIDRAKAAREDELAERVAERLQGQAADSEG